MLMIIATHIRIFFKVQSITSKVDSEMLEVLGENLNVLQSEIEKQFEANLADAN